MPNPVEKAVNAYRRGGTDLAKPLFAKLTTPEKRQYFIRVKQIREARR